MNTVLKKEEGNEIFYEASCSTTMIACCDAPFRVQFFTQQSIAVHPDTEIVEVERTQADAYGHPSDIRRRVASGFCSMLSKSLEAKK